MPRSKDQPLRRSVGNREDNEHQQRPHGEFPAVSPMGWIEVSIQPSDKSPEKGDGMQAVLRISRHRIEKKRRHGGDGRGDHRASPAAMIAAS